MQVQSKPFFAIKNSAPCLTGMLVTSCFNLKVSSLANLRTTKPRGFTMIEMMAVLVVIAIMALTALPSLFERAARQQVEEVQNWAKFATVEIEKIWRTTSTLPADNKAAGLPEPSASVSTFAKSLTVQDGVITIVLGNEANRALQGKTLTLRPAIARETPILPVAWVCAGGKAPPQLTVQGTDKTDVPDTMLPVRCRKAKS
jgi:type IV pilus assembly protein PilA